MKEFLPILIGALFFAVQTYSNYKKEQEKAKNRKLGRPVPDDTIPVEVETNVPKRKAVRRPEIKRGTDTQRKVASSPRPTTPRPQIKTPPLPGPKQKPNYHEEIPLAEGGTPRYTPSFKSTPRELNKRIELEHLEPYREGGDEGAEIDVDLREAVIHQVILERKF